MPPAGIGAGKSDQDRVDGIVSRKLCAPASFFVQMESTSASPRSVIPKTHIPDPRGCVHRCGDDAPAVGAEDGAPEFRSWPSISRRISQLAASQMRAVWSIEAVTMRAPSALNAAVETRPVWPLSSCSKPPVSTS
jgi:hypothetical protein